MEVSQDPNPIRSALYYPFPFVQDDQWLKLAALFWDSIYKIVPVGFSRMSRGDSTIVEPSETERILRGDEFGFVKEYEMQRHGLARESRLAAVKLLDMIDTFPDFFSSRMKSVEEYFSGMNLRSQRVTIRPFWSLNVEVQQLVSYQDSVSKNFLDACIWLSWRARSAKTTTCQS